MRMIFLPQVLILLWLYFVVTTPGVRARRPWSLHNLGRHGSVHPPSISKEVVVPGDVPPPLSCHHNAATLQINCGLPSTTSPGMTTAIANMTNFTSEYVVVSVLGIGGGGTRNRTSRHSEMIPQYDTTIPPHANSGCILVEIRPLNSSSSSSAIIKIDEPQLRYHYYPNIFQTLSSSSSSNESLPILWHGVGLLSDVIIIHVDSLPDHSDSDDEEASTTYINLIPALVDGLRQRQSASLSPPLIYIITSNTTTSDDHIQRFHDALQTTTTLDMVHSIKIVHGSPQLPPSSPTEDIEHQNNLVDIPIPLPKENGSHTLTDRSIFIHVLKETFHRLACQSSNHQTTVLPFSSTGIDDVIVIDSVTANNTNRNESIVPHSNNNPAAPQHENNHETRATAPRRQFPKLSFGWKPVLFSRQMPFMRRLKSVLPRIFTKRSVPQSTNEDVLYSDGGDNDDDLWLEIDQMHQRLSDIQHQQEDFVVSSIDTPNVAVLDLVPMMNPIIEQLHHCILLLRSKHQHKTAESSSRLDSIYEQIATVYDYQCNSILRNYYGTMYETIFDQQRHQWSTKWVHSLQERVKENYLRDVRHIFVPLERYNDVYLSFQQKPNTLDINKLISNFMSDVQDITELHIDLSDIDNDNDDTNRPMSRNDILNPTQYRNRLRRQRLYQFSQNVLKRAVMIAINYIQGYMAIQSIRHIALQQEREMPKFPLF